MPSVEIRKISYQNFVAAGVIQRCWRGYRARKLLWCYGGARYNFCVLKVQCAWRMHLANKMMLAAWHRKVYLSVHIMQSLYYRWHSKRLRWILHLSFLKKCVVKLQSAYRRRAARRIFELVKEAFRNRTAEKIQAAIRKFIGRCRYLRRKRLVETLLHHINEAAPLYTSSSRSKSETSINDDRFSSVDYDSQCFSVYQEVLNQVIRILHKLLIMNQFHQALVDTERTLQLIDMQLMIDEEKEDSILSALDISNPETWPKENMLIFTQSHTPVLIILRTIVLTCKTCCWAKYGRTKQVNVNTLEQTMGIAQSMMYEQRKYYAMWCQRRRILANERARILRSYEAKVAAAEKAARSKANGESGVDSDRRSSSVSLQQRRRAPTSKHQSLNVSRKPSRQTMNVGKSPSTSDELLAKTSEENVHVSFNINIPMPNLPVVPDFEDSIQTFLHERIWHQFSVYEILDVFHMISSWPRYSLLTQYDACFCKGSMLHALLYLEHWKEITAGSVPQLIFQHQLPKDQLTSSAMREINNQSALGDDSSSIVSQQSSTKLPTNPSSESINHHRVSTVPFSENDPKLTIPKYSFIPKEYIVLRKMILPLFGYAIQQAPDAEKIDSMLRLDGNESEDSKKEQVLQRYSAMRHIMQRAWRLTERAKHLISTGSPESYELYQRLEFMASVNVPARIVFRHKKIIPMTTSIKKSRFDANDPDAANSETNSNLELSENSPIPGEGRKRRRKDHNGSVQFQEILPTLSSRSAKKEDDLGKDVAVTINISVEYTVVQSGPMMFFFGQIDEISVEPYMYMSKPEWVDSCLRDTPYREVPWLLQRTGAVPLQPFILFSHELKQLATSNSLYVVKGALYKPQSVTTLKAVHEDGEDDQDDPEDTEDNEEESQSAASENVSSLSKKPVLDQLRFQEYVNENIGLSYVPILSPAAATSSFNIPYRPLINNLDGNYQPPISCRMQPTIALSLPFTQEKRDRSINFNEIRYATLLLQRLYRGFAGRLRFKRIAAKKREIMRRWWLATKVFNFLRSLRHKHEFGAIKLQAMVKGWLWRRRLQRMNRAALSCQCAFRIFRAKCQVYAERMRKEGGPQVIDMLRGGKLMEVFDRRFMLNMFRCGYNYRLEGFDMIRGTMYHGHLHQAELQEQLFQYNQDVIAGMNGDRTSLASKQAQINLWQHEKVVQYILQHLQLIHRIYGVTNSMGGSLEDANNDLCLIVSYETQSKIHEKLQAPRLPDLMNHPVIEYVKFKPSPFSSFKGLRQQEQQRQRRLQQRNRNNNQKEISKSLPQISSAK